MATPMSDKVLSEALKSGHGSWRVRTPGWDEEYFLRLEKASLNSDSYRLVFATVERHAWDVAQGRNAQELMLALENFFPAGLVAV
jgi:hypothetical protein